MRAGLRRLPGACLGGPGWAPGKGFAQMMKGLETGRIQVASRALGVASAALEDALAYAQDRESFGQPIWKHQAVGNYLADMATKLTGRRVVSSPGTPPNAMTAVSAATWRPEWLLFASEVAMEIALNAVRIHGGYGYSTEYDVERYFRDAPLMIVGEGTNEIQRNVIAWPARRARRDLTISSIRPHPNGRRIDRLTGQHQIGGAPASDAAGDAHRAPGPGIRPSAPARQPQHRVRPAAHPAAEGGHLQPTAQRPPMDLGAAAAPEAAGQLVERQCRAVPGARQMGGGGSAKVPNSARSPPLQKDGPFPARTTSVTVSSSSATASASNSSARASVLNALWRSGRLNRIRNAVESLGLHRVGDVRRHRRAPLGQPARELRSGLQRRVGQRFGDDAGQRRAGGSMERRTSSQTALACGHRPQRSVSWARCRAPRRPSRSGGRRVRPR